jgi:hypothetical protein
MMREQQVIWKTAGFCKRNWLRFLDYAGRTEYLLWKVGKGVKHGVQHMAHGLKNIFRDGRWLVKTQHRGLQNKYVEVSYKEKTRVR